YQLVVATRACVDEVRTRRPRGPSRAGRYRATANPRGALRAHPRGALQRTTWERGHADASSSHRLGLASPVASSMPTRDWISGHDLGTSPFWFRVARDRQLELGDECVVGR